MRLALGLRSIESLSRFLFAYAARKMPRPEAGRRPGTLIIVWLNLRASTAFYRLLALSPFPLEPAARSALINATPPRSRRRSRPRAPAIFHRQE